MTVHPAPWYVGVKRLPYFTEQKNGLKTEVVVVGLDGVARCRHSGGTEAHANPVAERPPGGRRRLLHVGHEPDRDPVGSWTVTTGTEPIPFEAALPNGGNFVLTATGRGAGKLFAVTTYLLLRARRRLHRVGALRPQPDRARPGAQDVEAG